MIQVKTERGYRWVAGGPLGDGEWVRVFSDFGPRAPFQVTYPDGSTRWTSGFHTGVDISDGFRIVRNPGPAGTVTISDVYDDSSEGVWTRLRYNDDWSSDFYHLGFPLHPRGKIFQRGEIIGLVGDPTTGMSTGPHLHWTMLYRGHAVDPLGAQALAFLNSGAPRTYTRRDYMEAAVAAIARGEYVTEIENGRTYLDVDRVLLPE